MLFLQAAISAVLSTPLNPFLGKYVTFFLLLSGLTLLWREF